MTSGTLYNKHDGPLCTEHTVRLMRATVCLCNSDGCNGAGVPTEDATDNHHVVEIQQLKIKAEADALKNSTAEMMHTSSGDLRAALHSATGVPLLTRQGRPR